MLHTIEHAKTEPDYKVRLDYSDGTTFLVNFASVIQEGGVFSTLADPEVFKQVTIGPRGRSICWPGEIDFCADALRMQGQVISRKVSSAA
jgi:hypothetical protein